MARSRNDKIRRRIGKAIINGTLSSAGTITAAGVGTTLHANFDSSGALLNSDSAGYADGSLHYLSKLKKMYVWDDSDGQFFELTGLDSSAAAGALAFQGTVSGYASGGVNPTPAVVNIIEKYSFTSDANATDVGDLLTILRDPSGQSSSTHGYVTGGNDGTTLNVIQKYPFAVDANSADVGDLTQVRREMAGASSNANGYASGGNAPTPIGIQINIIDKFPFSVDTNATDAGDLTVQRRYVTAGQSSSTHGYASGGQETPANADTSTIIDKFPFASDANATDVGDLIEQVRQAMGQNSASHGYHSGGRVYSPVPASVTTSGVIQKFSFSTDGNASDVGDLTLVRFVASGSSSTSSGYTAGGGSPANQNIIDKFPFASDANATDVGDLTAAKVYLSGQQV